MNPLDLLLSSSILPGESGGIPDEPKAAPAEGGLTTVKGPSTKGGFNYGTVALDPTNSAEILKNMQKFIDERSSPYNKFISNIDDARAAAVANVRGEGTRAVNEREEQKLKSSKELFDMRNQMAALKAAQAMQGYQRKTVADALNGGAPSTTEVPTSTSPASSAPAQVTQSLVSKIDPTIIAAIKAKAVYDPAGAQADLQKELTALNTEQFKIREGFNYNAPAQKQEQYTVSTPDGVQQVDLTPVQWMEVQRSGKLPDGTPISAGNKAAPRSTAPVAPQTATPAVVPPAATQGTGISPTTIAQVESGNKPFAEGPNVPGQGTAKSSMQVMDATATDPGFGVKPAQLTGDKAHDEAERTRVGTEYFGKLKEKYGNDTLASIAYNMGPGATDQWLASGADIKKLPPETRDYVAKAHITNATSGRNATTEAAPKAQAAAPTAAKIGANEQQVQDYWNVNPPKNKAEFERRKSEIDTARAADVSLASKKEETSFSAKTKSTEEERTKAGDFISKINELAGKAPNAITSADRIITHASTKPKDFGWSYESGPRGALINTAGLVPHFGKDLSHAVEKELQGFQGKEAATRRANSEGAAANLGFDFAAETFTGTGARLGLGLEQMANKAKSVGPEYPAETNILNAKLVKYAYTKATEQSKAWDKYKSSHENADPYAFLNSPEFQTINQKWEKKISELLPDNKNLKPEEATTSGGRKPLSSFHR
ncbi:LT_GEWL domain containing protein [uncultured Caudovirales phage]|uniref:LT_GEWL domain containing protein n=1 Tax=uncultured Caudovirales phage TaxID=2100421 RepID=A0A6J5L3W0_9CAUD|nr:LT_GEWL domain containing protein [uncultured Caudovirales phage]